MTKHRKLTQKKRKEILTQNLKEARTQLLIKRELEKQVMNPTTPKEPAVPLPPRDPQPYMVRVPKKMFRVGEKAPVPAASLESSTARKCPLPPYNPRKLKQQRRYSPPPPPPTAKERQRNWDVQEQFYEEQQKELRLKHSQEIMVWKERFERSQAERKSLERRMYRQAQEFQERFDETVDNLSWKERYAHLENFCRTCKGENINLKVELNGIKKEVDKRDKEITELQLDLAYVRSLCTMPIPPRNKKPRKPRKPKLPKLLPPPLSPSTINL